jgi:hypothetical protein
VSGDSTSWAREGSAATHAETESYRSDSSHGQRGCVAWEVIASVMGDGTQPQ